MSILGYSAAYFFPEYWSSTPLYGEKIIPLIDYILSADYEKADTLANAFYLMENKYKNTADLPIECIKAIIEESGYGYVLELLGTDEESIRLLTYLLVLINQLKGTGLGIEVVLNLLRKDSDPMSLVTVGKPTINNGIVSDFSQENYIFYEGFTVDSSAFDLTFAIRTGNLTGEQTIASIGGNGLYLGLDSQGHLILTMSSKNSTDWDIVNRANGTSSGVLTPNTNYYIRLTYDGYEYNLKVSTDNKKYSDYLVINSSTPLSLHKSVIYLGIAKSLNGTMVNPFKGYIDLSPFSANINNVKITQWFETLPVGEENTFQVQADLDLGVVSSDFFTKFSSFVKKYVYPTLEAFEASLSLESNLTFIPYVRQKITYVNSTDVQEQSENWFRENMPIDSEFSYESKHALQNKVVTEEIGDLDSVD